MEGQTLLSETLAQYSAMMIMKRLNGEDHIRRHRQFELAEYLHGRVWGAANERPLVRTEMQSWVSYHKGSLAMYVLQERLDEDAVSRALRKLLQRFRFNAAQYPRSLDLVTALRARGDHGGAAEPHH